MHFNGGIVSIECVKYRPFIGGSDFKISTQKPFTIIVKTGYQPQGINVEVPSGEHTLQI